MIINILLALTLVLVNLVLAGMIYDSKHNAQEDTFELSAKEFYDLSNKTDTEIDVAINSL